MSNRIIRAYAVVASAVAMLAFVPVASAQYMPNQPTDYPAGCPAIMVPQNCVQHAWTNNGTAINPAKAEWYLGKSALSQLIKDRFRAYVQTYWGVDPGSCVEVYGTSATFPHNLNRMHAVGWIATCYGRGAFTNLAAESLSGVACVFGGDVGGTDISPTLSLVEHGIQYAQCVQYNNWATHQWIAGAPTAGWST